MLSNPLKTHASVMSKIGRPMKRVPERMFLSLSVFELKAAGALKKGATLRWNDGSVIRVSPGVDHVMLNEVPIGLEYTQLASGGWRPWFVCPSCRNRCARLFLLVNWQCRVCSNVGYASEQERPGPMFQVHRVSERIAAGRWPYLERKLLARRSRIIERIRRME